MGPMESMQPHLPSIIDFVSGKLCTLEMEIRRVLKGFQTVSCVGSFSKDSPAVSDAE